MEQYEDIIKELAEKLHAISPDWELADGTMPDASFINTKYSVAEFFITLSGNIVADNDSNKERCIDFRPDELVLIANACMRIANLRNTENKCNLVNKHE